MDAITYAMSKKYTDSKVSQSAGLHREIVTSLPATGDENTIYMVLDSSATGSDIYDEWLWTNGAYEHIGSTRVDLTDYYNKTQVDTALNGKANVATSLAGYGITNAYTKSEVETMLREFIIEETYSNTSKMTVTAGGSSSSKIDVTKSGYTPIGISKVHNASTPHLSLMSFGIGLSGSGKYIASVYYCNDTTSTITVNAGQIDFTILYVKNY